MRLAIITLAVATAAVSTFAIAANESPLGPAPPRGTGLPKGQCIYSEDMRNHTIADRKTMLIDVDGKAIYRITVDGGCLAGAVSSDPIIMQQPPGSRIICRPIDLDLSISRGGFPSRCIVDSIVKLSAEEVAALPKRLRP